MNGVSLEVASRRDMPSNDDDEDEERPRLRRPQLSKTWSAFVGAPNGQNFPTASPWLNRDDVTVKRFIVTIVSADLEIRNGVYGESTVN